MIAGYAVPKLRCVDNIEEIPFTVLYAYNSDCSSARSDAASSVDVMNGLDFIDAVDFEEIERDIYVEAVFGHPHP